MPPEIKEDRPQQLSLAEIPIGNGISTTQGLARSQSKNKTRDKDAAASAKRRCVSSACVACRKRKSKCDGNLPKCAACASVYMTECEYAPHTDHRRKGVYKKDVDATKTRNSTLQILIQAILNAEESDVMDLVQQIRSCDSLEELANTFEAQEKGLMDEINPSPDNGDASGVPQFEAELSGKMGDLMLDGSVKFIGGTSNLIWLPEEYDHRGQQGSQSQEIVVRPREEAILSWTTVTQDKEAILHFINMYFCWHYAFFTTLARELFYRDFLTGTISQYCSALLVNIMLALGCHFSSRSDARQDPEDSGTTGDHFFAEAKRLLYENDEFGNTKLCTVQALALMSVREAGCGHESKGWVYSGMSFRMACDLGLNVDAVPMNEESRLPDEDIDARRVTFWGVYLFDKCWSNYLGRQPQLQLSNITVKRPDVFPKEDSEMWSPYTDTGIIQANAQPARTRAVALQLSNLAEISSDLLTSFYHPQLLDKPPPRQTELKRLSDLHTRLEAWRSGLPAEMEAREGQLPQVFLMHMFFQLLYIHLYRPFLKYNRTTSPLPVHISPRKYCTQGAAAISKLFRLYKRTYGLRQICNIAIYMIHSACTIHLLNLPDKNARRDIVHGVKHLEEVGECWTAARRTLRVLHLCADRWNITMPEEADTVYTRIRVKWGVVSSAPSPVSPESLANMAQQVTSQPVAEIMARNIQQQQQSETIQPAMATQQVHRSSMQSSPTSADTSEFRRVSAPSSMPPRSSADPSRTTMALQPSPTAMQGREGFWDMHQARLAATRAGMQSMPAVYGHKESQQPSGVDRLLEESQDWVFRDQNQLAMGFGNWASEPPDWGTLDLSYFDTPGTTGSSNNVSTDDNSPAYIGSMDQSYQPQAANYTLQGYAPSYTSHDFAMMNNTNTIQNMQDTQSSQSLQNGMMGTHMDPSYMQPGLSVTNPIAPGRNFMGGGKKRSSMEMNYGGNLQYQ